MAYVCALKKIPFYIVHPEYMPYIGEHFEKYRILLIGESHYLDQYYNPSLTPLEDMQGWWEGKQKLSVNEQQYMYHTRNVVQRYVNGYRTQAHGIFTNTARVFAEVVLGLPNVSAAQASEIFQHFAFMNFFQQPSLYFGKSYWDALLKATGESSSTGRHPKALGIWTECVEHSVGVVDSVIETLNPQRVIFVSAAASEAYSPQYGNGKYAHEDFIFYTYHPGSRYWNIPGKLTGGVSGKAAFANALEGIKK